jgi:peroxiredoxin
MPSLFARPVWTLTAASAAWASAPSAFAMIVDNGVVTSIAKEDTPGQTAVSSAAQILEALAKPSAAPRAQA